MQALEELKGETDIIRNKIKEDKDSLKKEKGSLVKHFYFILESVKVKIDEFLKIQNNKMNLPKFKETINSEENIKLEKTTQLLKDLLPELTDDDYFVDLKDSLVYTYLMTDNVS